MPRLKTILNWSMVVQILRSEHFLGWSQERLARALEVSVFSVSKWERGEVKPTPKNRDALKELALQAGFRREDWPVEGLTGPRAIDSFVSSDLDDVQKTLQQGGDSDRPEEAARK